MDISKGRRSTRIVVTAACAVMASMAYAGSRYGQPSVSIYKASDGSGYAMGTLGGVRNSVSRVERLSCAVSRSESTNSRGIVVRTTAVDCAARDNGGILANCSSKQEKHAVALNGVSNDSLIEFHFDATGQCTTIWVYESASLERKRA